MFLINHLLNLVFPRQCVACHTLLTNDEHSVCLGCLYHLPRTNYHNARGNEIEQMLNEWFPTQRATAFFFFHKGSPFQKLLHELKYNSQPEIGVEFGKFIGTALAGEPDFSDIDVIVPVPLHPKKFRIRGYNQSERIANGIAQRFNRPIDSKNLVRIKANPSQTTKTAEERRKNVENIFMVKNQEIFRDKHILLVDDVLTTGATLASCARELLKSGNVRISVATLAKA